MFNGYKLGSINIIKVNPVIDYKLELYFDNGDIKVYNMQNNLTGVFLFLKENNRFREVFIDEDWNIAWDIDKALDSTVKWDNRVTICKDEAYMKSYDKVKNIVRTE